MEAKFKPTCESNPILSFYFVICCSKYLLFKKICKSYSKFMTKTNCLMGQSDNSQSTRRKTADLNFKLRHLNCSASSKLHFWTDLNKAAKTCGTPLCNPYTCESYFHHHVTTTSRKTKVSGKVREIENKSENKFF
jgi:hypothetical protein